MRTTIGTGGWGQTTIRPAYERLHVRMRDEYLYEGKTDYFFCVRPSIGRLRRRSKHLGGALFPLIPSKIPVGAVEESDRRAESFCHV